MVKLQKKLDLVYENNAIIRMAADVLNVILLVYALNMGWLGSCDKCYCVREAVKNCFFF